MTREEAKSFIINISYKLGNMAVEYLTEKDGEKMREAIKALEQETILGKIEKEINSPNRGTCDYFIVDRIEEIINKYKAEREVEE